MKYALLFVLISLSSVVAYAEESIPVLTIKNHRFTPTELKVKAGARFKVTVKNEDATSEEFESKTMIVEKFIGPQRTMTLTLGPLKPGVYDFFGDFHPSTAQGKVIAE